MQAAIMAAGKGERLESITRGKPKGLIEISGRPVIDWTLSYFEEANINRVLMTVGYEKEEYYRHLAGRDVSFVFNPFYECGQVLSSFWFILNELEPLEDLIFCHADTIIEKAILDRLIASKEDIVLPFDADVCDDESMKVKIDSKFEIEKITKEMPCSEANGEFIGFAKISGRIVPELIKACSDLISQGALGAYFEDALQYLKNHGISPLTALDITGLQWAEIDFPEDFEKASKFTLP
jgi:choline kinase